MDQNEPVEEKKNEREKIIFLANLYEKANREKEMLSYINDFINLEPKLTKEERLIFGNAYKKAITPKRNSWRTIVNLQKKEEIKVNKSYCEEIKQIIEGEIKEICVKIQDIIDKKLLPNAQVNESKIYYITLKGDYYRYMCEITPPGNELDEYKKLAKESYQKALDFAKYISILNSSRLGLVLNYSLFLYEFLGMKKEGVSLAKTAYEDAVTSIENKKNKGDLEKQLAKDSLFLIQLIKENFIFWTGEMPEDELS